MRIKEEKEKAGPAPWHRSGRSDADPAGAPSGPTFPRPR
jgi:hypothetical protein